MMAPRHDDFVMIDSLSFKLAYSASAKHTRPMTPEIGGLRSSSSPALYSHRPPALFAAHFFCKRLLRPRAMPGQLRLKQHRSIYMPVPICQPTAAASLASISGRVRAISTAKTSPMLYSSHAARASFRF